MGRGMVEGMTFRNGRVGQLVVACKVKADIWGCKTPQGRSIAEWKRDGESLFERKRINVMQEQKIKVGCIPRRPHPCKKAHALGLVETRLSAEYEMQSFVESQEKQTTLHKETLYPGRFKSPSTQTNAKVVDLVKGF